MGSKLCDYWKESVSKEIKWAFVSTFVATLLIHIYKFTNTLPNSDSMYNFYSDQNVLGSGRWALSIACGISSYFDLPWINGLISAVWIAFTAVLIVLLLKIKNPIVILLTAGLLASSVGTTQTLCYEFTADGYFLAMFLAAMGVWLTRIGEERIWMNGLGCVFVCIACGIYQAYVSFALVLAVIHFWLEAFRGQWERKQMSRWLLRQVIVYVCALAVYYAVWKGMLWLTGTTANDYQGISSVGLDINTLIGGLKRCITSTVGYFLQWNVLENGWTLYAILNVLFLIVFVIGFIIAVIKSGVWHKPPQWIWCIVGVIAVFPFACMWHFTSDGVSYRPLMLQSLILLYIATACIYEEWACPVLKNSIGILLAIIVFNNALIANISYYYMNVCYERTYAEASAMMVRIDKWDSTEDFDSIAVIGDRLAAVQWEFIDSETGHMNEVGNVHMVVSCLEETLMFDHHHIVPFLQNVMGLELEKVSAQEREELEHLSQVQDMAAWPAENSMTVIDNVLVIKIAE